jgi:hypothetical protein
MAVYGGLVSQHTGGKWKKGAASPNPKGRPPILMPELQRELDTQKGAVKQLVLRYFALTEAQIAKRQMDKEIPFIEKILGQCFERTALDGDVDKFRKLLEIVFGKIPEEKVEFEISAEEKMLVLSFRRRLQDGGTPPSSTDGS